MKLTLQPHKSSKELENKLEKAGFKVSDYAKELLTKIKPRKKKEVVELEIKTSAELGLPNGGTFEQIKAEAEKQGLSLCPPEVGPSLRLESKDQPKGEWLRIAMEPVAVSGGGLSVFDVARDAADLWLGTSWFYPRAVFPPGGRWVFVRKYRDLENRVKVLEEDMAKLNKLINI